MFMHTTSHTTSHMHDRAASTGVCMALYSFRHRPPHLRRQGQAAPERNCLLSRQRWQGQHPLLLRGLWMISPPRCGGAVSKRTYSLGQKEPAICAQHARAIAGAHARNAAHVELRHACALAGAHECMLMHACAHVARRQRGF